MEPIPQRLVPGAASPDGAAAASPGRTIVAGSGVGESLRRLRIYAERSRESLQRLFTAGCHGMVAVSGISKTNGPESVRLAWADLHKINSTLLGEEAFKNNRRLKEAGKEARGVFKGWSVRAPTQVSKINGPERSEWPDSHSRTRGGDFEK